MRYIIEQLVASGKTLGLGGTSRFYVDNCRLQRNLERVMADPAMTAAAMAGVIVDHRVVETMVKAEELVRTVILKLEMKLGRKLSRDRAQKLLATYHRVCEARTRESTILVLPARERLRMAA